MERSARSGPAAASAPAPSSYDPPAGFPIAPSKHRCAAPAAVWRRPRCIRHVPWRGSERAFESISQVGLVYCYPTAARPKDTIDIGVSRFQVNTDFRRNAQLINTLNQVTHIRHPRYVPVQDRKYSFEVNYGYQATGWLMVRLNLQYVRYPGGMREVDDAVVVGVQVVTDF